MKDERGCDWVVELCMNLFLFLRNFPQALITSFQLKKKYCFCLSLPGRKDFSSTLCSFSAQEVANKIDRRQIKKRKDKILRGGCNLGLVYGLHRGRGAEEGR